MDTPLTTAESQDTMKDYLKGTGLSTDGDTQYYVNYGVVATEAAGQEALSFNSGRRFDNVKGNTSAYGVELTVIDNNDDGIVDYVLWLQETLTQVTANETTVFNAINGNRTIDNEDIVTEADLAEGDLELLVSYGGRYYVSDPEVITGEMEAYEASRTEEQTITVSGTEYNPSYIVYKAESADNTYEFNIRECDDGLDGVQFDTTYDFILDSNGNVIAYQPSEQGLYNYALILESGYEPGAFASDASGKVTALLPDGTKGTYTLNFSASAKNVGEQIDKDNYTTSMGIAELKGFLGTSDSDNSSTAPWKMDGVFTSSKKADGTTNADQYDFPDGMAVGYVVGYSLNDNNVMTITSIVGSNTDDDPKVSEYNGGYDEALYSDYDTGAGRVYYSASERLTVDLNTVAFYFVDKDTDGEADSGEYGVAVGYNEMSDVAAGVDFVADTLRDTTLATVILFEAEGKQAEKDYVYVLKSNRVTGDIADLQVVYMDGTIGTMTIDRDNYNDVLPTNDDFETAYAYKADGEMFELDDQDLKVIEGYAWKLRDGTIEVYKNPSKTVHIDDFSYTTDVVWNVENVSGLEKAPAASFTNTVGREVVLVVNTAEDRVRAAFVESVVTDETAPGFDFTLELDDPYEIGNRLWDVADIHGWLKDEVNVLINDNWNNPVTSGDLVIPRDLGVQFNGDVDMQGYDILNDSNGKLIVNGNLLYEGPLDGRVNAESLTLDGGAVSIEVTTVVTDAINLNGQTLTVKAGATLNAGSITGTGTINVEGTLEVAGDVDNSSIDINLDDSGTATINGKLVARNVALNDTSTLTVDGDATVTSVALNAATNKLAVEGNLTGDIATLAGGSVTVDGDMKGDLPGTWTGSVSVGANMTTTSAITVDTDQALTVGGILDTQGAAITVVDGKTLSVGGLGTNVSAVGAVTLGTNGSTTDTTGTLKVTGDAYTGAVDVKNGTMEVKNLTTSGAVAVGVDSTADTSGKLTVTGTLTANGNITVPYGTMSVTGNIANDIHTVTVGTATTAGTLTVTGQITGSGGLTVTKGSAEVGGVAVVAEVVTGQSLTVRGDAGTVNKANGDVHITGSVTGALSLDSGTVVVDGNVNNFNYSTGTVTVHGNVTTLGGSNQIGNVTIDGDVLNPLGDAVTGTLTIGGDVTLNDTPTASLTVNLKAGSNLILDASSNAVDVSSTLTLTAEENASVTIKGHATNDITQGTVINLVGTDGTTPVTSPIDDTTDDGTYVYNGSVFVKQ